MRVPVESRLGAVGGRGALRLFCDDFVKAASARGGEGHAFVGAAALWICLKAVDEGGGGECDVLDLAAEVAMAGDASGVISGLRWAESRVAVSCAAIARNMMNRSAAAFVRRCRTRHIRCFRISVEMICAGVVVLLLPPTSMMMAAMRACGRALPPPCCRRSTA